MTDRQFDVEPDRSRLCQGPHATAEVIEAIGAWTCPLCANIGLLPPDVGVEVEQRHHFAAEAIPPNHPAATEESYIVGYGPGHRRR